MSGVDDEPISFDSSPTGRFGLAAVSERGEEPSMAQGTPRPVPSMAQGTPRSAPVAQGTPRPAPSMAQGTPRSAPVAQGTPRSAPGAQGTPRSAPAVAQATLRPAPQGSGLPLDGPTLEHAPVSIGLGEENAPLDRDPTERGLLAAVASGDESSRAVYAEWLEERSEHARAGFLRIEQLVARMSPADPRYEACTRQLRELERHIDPDWRARVGRPPIEGCPAFEVGCPRRWDALVRTEREDVRYCGSCAKHVYYFENADAARDAAQGGHCVAIALGAERWENDLEDAGTRCWSCSRRVVSTAQFCPHCGESLRVSELVTMGVLAD